MEKPVKPVVQLRIYKGSEKTFNEKRECLNENQKVTLTWDTLEWTNYFKYLAASGFGIVEVEQCFGKSEYNAETNEYVSEKIDTPKNIREYIDNVFKAEEKEMTPDQKRIADLEAKLDALTKDKKEPKAPK